MKTLCTCGFDCSDFLEHHQIPPGAQFDCPACDKRTQPVRPAFLQIPQSPNLSQSAERLFPRTLS